MKIRVFLIAAVSLLLVGGSTVALTVSMSGSGSVGDVLPGWSVLEQCTPAMPGDSRGSVGSASFSARATADSRFVANNDVELTSPGGTFRGRVSEVAVGARADVSVAGAAQFLNVERTMPPVWFNDSNDFLAYTYGSGTGQVASVYGIAVDPVDGGILVGSYGTVDGVDRYKVIKYTAAGVYVTEFGSFGSGDGQFGGSISVAVSPVDQAVWVGDGSNRRLQKFVTADGGLTYTYSAKVGSAGTGNGQFNADQNIVVAVDSGGNVYATDKGGTRLQKFNTSAVYQAQVSTGGVVNRSPYSVSVGPTDLVYTTILGPLGAPVHPGTIQVYNTSLVLQTTLTLTAPAGTSTGIANISVDPGGDIWAQWLLAPYLVRYDPTGVEIDRWYSLYPTAQDLNTNFNLAAGAAGLYVMFRPNSGINPYGLSKYGGNYVTGTDYSPVVLSDAIQNYMEACDPTLNGWTLDYQATTDPAVVFPGWSGNVWANLKELFATYNIELVQDAATKTFIIRDIGSVTTEFKNMKPALTRPVNLTGGRVVDVIYQQPRAGGGVVWDAALENESVSIAAGASAVRILATDNHPVELAQPVATDTLPIQPGQYYIVDSTGTHVPADDWAAAGGNLVLVVGESPGTISATFTGPGTDPTGFTGPYKFATGNTPADTPALSIVGNGTFTTPALFSRAGSQGSPFNSPFIDTIDRILNRGHYPSLQDPHVVVELTVPTADLPAMGQAVGTIFVYEQSRYRIIEVRWGNLNSTVTAERYVTTDDFDTLWAANTIGDIDTFWSGFTLSDIQIQPLRN